jgi:hypothetical protein
MESIERVAEQLELENDKRAAANPLVKQSIAIVRKFVQTHPVMCYGGIAINDLLPKDQQFYDPTINIPDYDFYSKTPQEHAMTLANQLSAAGIVSVEVSRVCTLAPSRSLPTLRAWRTLPIWMRISLIGCGRKMWCETKSLRDAQLSASRYVSGAVPAAWRRISLDEGVQALGSPEQALSHDLPGRQERALQSSLRRSARRL